MNFFGDCSVDLSSLISTTRDSQRLKLCAGTRDIYIYIYITCTEENRLSTNKNFIQTQRVSASAFIRGPYIGFINQLMISYCDVIKKCSLLD